MISKATGIILAGGKSVRMGEDKSLIPFHGKPLIEIVINRLSPLFKNLLIISNQPELYEKYRLRIHSDILKGRGPLGGIYTGLIASADIYNLVVACDMPFISQGLVKYMLKKSDGYDAVIAEYDGRPQPLCAVYSKDCIKPAEKALAENNLKLTDFINTLKARRIKEEEVESLDNRGLSFANINTRKDYQWMSEKQFAE